MWRIQDIEAASARAKPNPIQAPVRRARFGGGPVSPIRWDSEAGIFRRVAQRFANLVDGFVEAVIEVDDRLAPKFLLQLLPGHQLPGFFQQHRQDLKRLLLQPDAQAALGQFAGAKIDLEDAKP